MKREAFPLQWPDGWKRTRPELRKKSPFGYRNSGDVPFSFAHQELIAELKRLGAANAVVTTDLPTNSRGIPYADSRKSGEVGVAVWFVLDGHERVHACDKWRTVAENMIAIAKSIEAMRGLARWGAADIVERAFAGFTALPAAGETSVETPAATAIFVRTWQAAFEVEALVGVVSNSDLLAIVKARHRDLIKKHHPDLGGDLETATELNAALAAAVAELV